jgi:hypothetical protein
VLLVLMSCLAFFAVDTLLRQRRDRPRKARAMTNCMGQGKAYAPKKAV